MAKKQSRKAEPTPDQVKTFLKHALKSRDMPPIDINDAKQVKERADWYFQSCMEDGVKPGIEGLANALGVSRRTLDRWASETTRGQEHRDVIIAAKSILSELMEQYMLSGAINPVAGIFLMSNTMDYERNAMPSTNVQVNLLADGSDTKRIADKYRADVIDVEAGPAKQQISMDNVDKTQLKQIQNLQNQGGSFSGGSSVGGSFSSGSSGKSFEDESSLDLPFQKPLPQMNWNSNFRTVAERTRDKRLREELERAREEEAQHDRENLSEHDRENLSTDADLSDN